MNRNKGKRPTTIERLNISTHDNLSVLSVSEIEKLKRHVGKFMAHVRVCQLTKNVYIKAKLDNAVN